MTRSPVVLAAGFAALVLVVYADPLFFPRSFGGRDYPAYNLPLEKSIHDAYSRWRLPVWQADVSGGRPLLPNPNAGALYPLRLLLSPIRFPFAMKIFPLIHWILAGTGMLLFLRQLRVGAAGCWVAGATYAFSGVAVSEVFFPHIQPGLALLPWLMWAVSRPASALARVLSLSLLFALDLLAADIFTNALGFLAILLWIALEEERLDQRARLFQTLLAGACGALAAAPQILATAFWLPETNRAVLGMNLAESFYFSVSPWRLAELAIPYAFGHTWTLDDGQTWGQTLYQGKTVGLFTTLYVGAFPLIAAALAWRPTRRGLRFGRVVLAAGLALAILPSLAPASWLAARSPFALRNPEKFAVAIAFGFAVLAGLAFDRIRVSGIRSRPLLAVGGVFALLALGTRIFASPAAHAAVSWIHAGSEKADLAAREIPGAIAEGGLLWIATVIALDLLRRNGRTAAGSAALLLTLVPIAANRRIALTFREEEVYAPTAFARVLDRLDPARAYRVLGESVYQGTSALDSACRAADPTYTQYARATWAQHTHVLWRRGTIFNYDFDSGDLSRMESLRRVVRYLVEARDPAPLFASLSLRWGIRFRDQPPLAGYRRFGGDRLQDWDVHSQARPAIRLLDSWREAPGALDALRALPDAAPGQIVLETGRSGPGSARLSQIQILEDSPERMRLKTSSLDSGWLFLVREFWSHRTVRIDGREAEVVPAHLAFSAVAVPAGSHEIVWVEELPGWRVSRWGPVLFLLILACVLWRWSSTRRPRAPEQSRTH